MITFKIPLVTPSLNENNGMHWGAKQKLAKQWHKALWVEWITGKHQKATGKRCLTVERVSKGECDEDNAYGGCKIPIDQLKKIGFLVDDNQKNMQLVVRQRKPVNGEEPHTKFTLTDLEDQ
jgi:hypothetical protein